VLVWSADHFLDSELLIPGTLSVAYSEGVVLSTQAFQLAAHDGGYSLQASQFHLKFNLASLFSGPIWIRDLTLADFILKVNESADDRANFSIPPIIIARAEANNLVVEYQEMSAGNLHSFTLDNLLIADADADGSLEVQAAGTFEGQAFTLDGSLPPLDKIPDTSTPKPIRLELVGEKINASLKGNINDPFTGKGLDLNLQASAQSVKQYFEFFGDGVPALGKLKVAAVLRGDYKTPRLEDIDLHLRRGEQVGLAVSGEVANARTGEGGRLQISVQSNNPEVLSWLLFKQQDRLSSINVEALLEINKARYFISNLDANAKTPEGLEIVLSGAGEIFRKGHKFRKRDAGFSVSIDAPKTSLFNMTDRRRFPDLGPVSGAAKLAAGLDAIGLYGTNINIGRKQGTHFSLQGDIGYIPLQADTEIRETGLQAKLTTVDLARLGRQLGYEWPDLGRAELGGELDIKDKELRLERASLSTGNPERPSIKASGNLATILNKGSSIDLVFDVVVADVVAAVSDLKPGSLGRLRGSTHISDMDGGWGLENISFVSSDTNLYRLNINGRFSDLKNFDGGNIKASFSVDDMGALGNALEIDLSRFATARAQGLLLGSKGKLSYRGQTSMGSTSSTTELDGILVDGKPQLSGKFEMPVLNLADFGLGSARGDKADKEAAPGNGDGHVFSRETLDISILNSLDLEVDLLIDEVTSKTTSIDSVDGHISIRDGHLIARPFHLNFEGGRSNVVIDVQDAEIPEYKISLTGNHVKLGSLLRQVEKDVTISGSSEVHAELEAKGRSPHELASSLDGTLRIELENASIPQKYITLLSADALGWIGSKSLFKDKQTDINCLLMSFNSNQGMVASSALVADGPKLSLGGRINLDLGAETLDIVLIPKQKKRILSSISPVKITGPMNNPKVDAIPAKAALQEIGTMALLPGVAISVKVLEEFWGFFDRNDKLGEGCKKLEQISAAAEKEINKETE
ncbi:MAG: AsmA family protein, partial [Gammaproteobacteria bacterium]